MPRLLPKVEPRTLRPISWSMTIRCEMGLSTWAWRLAISMALAVTAGCASLVGPPLYKPDKEGRARFDSHSVSTLCFNVWGCRIEYANRYQKNEPETKLLPPRRAGKSLTQEIRGRQGALRNFPPPAVVTWRSKDGDSHRAEIDLRKILRQEIYLHNVPSEDIRERASLLPPNILLVVDDHEVSVHMESFIPLRDSIEREFDDPYGYHQTVRVFSKNY